MEDHPDEKDYLILNPRFILNPKFIAKELGDPFKGILPQQIEQKFVLCANHYPSNDNIYILLP